MRTPPNARMPATRTGTRETSQGEAVQGDGPPGRRGAPQAEANWETQSNSGSGTRPPGTAPSGRAMPGAITSASSR